MFPIISSFGATGLLVEYEDMFPYHGKVAHLRAPHAYTPEDIAHLHTIAANNNLIIIPLVQTFGHFEVGFELQISKLFVHLLNFVMFFGFISLQFVVTMAVPCKARQVRTIFAEYSWKNNDHTEKNINFFVIGNGY